MRWLRLRLRSRAAPDRMRKAPGDPGAFFVSEHLWKAA